MPKTITGEIIEIDDILPEIYIHYKNTKYVQMFRFSLKIVRQLWVDIIISVNISLSEAVQRNNFETNKFGKSLGKK